MWYVFSASRELIKESKMRINSAVKLPQIHIYLFALITFVLTSCVPGPETQTVRWITFEELTQSLESQPPMNVGFDVDDTVLFSSPGYYYGQQKYSPGDRSFVDRPEFWQEMNNGLDKFSIPKDIARKLIQFHKERGDTIYFITARAPTETETVTALLAQTFDLKNPNPVIFTGFVSGKNLKIEPIQTNNIKIFYGDSDGDMEASQAAGARAIRILRPRNSTNKPIPKPGSRNEEVLVESEY
jgi:acid phosphatase (class B)